MNKLDIKEALHILLNEDDDEIKDIVNPFEGEKAQGWDAALYALALGLFGEDAGSGFQKGLQQKTDPRLEPLPIPNQKSNSDADDSESSQSDESNSDQQDNQNSSSKDDKENDLNNNGSLTQKEIEDLVDRIRQARNQAEDIIDDAGNPIERDAAEDAAEELSELEKEAKQAKTEIEANKIKARLKTIADFWDNPKNQTSLTKDARERKFDKQLSKELSQARLNAHKRKYEYNPMKIDQIVNNIIRTIKNETRDVRDSDWSRYNDRANELGYIAPGRYTDKKKDKPSVVFYFDISGSWCGDQIKIDMGHRIEEALKKLDKEEKIALSCFYFGTRVHDHFTKNDQGNSDAPIPHAIDLLNAGKLDNIIIMTDDNPSSNQKLQVPGFAWLLFYDTVSESLARNVSGKKGTKIIMINHN